MVPKWRKQAGFISVPGTLNVVLDHFPRLTIPCKGTVYRNGFPQDKVPVLIVRERSTGPGPLIELLAPVYLREKFNLVDGDLVVVNV